jgi:hypothetical protein
LPPGSRSPRQNEAHRQAISGHSLVEIHLKDPTGRSVTVNRQFKQAFGSWQHEISGTTVGPRSMSLAA